MTQATAIAMVFMFLSLMVGVVALVELHSMLPKARKTDVPERDISVLEEIEFEAAYSMADVDAWDIEAYKLYLEDAS